MSSKIPCMLLAVFVSTCLGGAPDYRCLRVQTPVVIDGSLAEWKDVKPIILNTKAQVVNGEWKGLGDLSGEVYLQWDHENLYGAATTIATRSILFERCRSSWN